MAGFVIINKTRDEEIKALEEAERKEAESRKQRELEEDKRCDEYRQKYAELVKRASECRGAENLKKIFKEMEDLKVEYSDIF